MNREQALRTAAEVLTSPPLVIHPDYFIRNEVPPAAERVLAESGPVDQLLRVAEWLLAEPTVAPAVAVRPRRRYRDDDDGDEWLENEDGTFDCDTTGADGYSGWSLDKLHRVFPGLREITEVKTLG